MLLLLSYCAFNKVVYVHAPPPPPPKNRPPKIPAIQFTDTY